MRARVRTRAGGGGGGGGEEDAAPTGMAVRLSNPTRRSLPMPALLPSPRSAATFPLPACRSRPLSRTARPMSWRPNPSRCCRRLNLDSETAENGEARRRRRSRRGGRNRHRETRPEGIAPVEVMPSGEWLPGLAQPQEPTDEIEAGSIMATTFGEVPPLTPAETAPAARPQDLTAEAQPTEPSTASSAAPAQAAIAAAPGSPSPAEPPVPPAPTGPKRTGWWQRAKASFGGN